MSVESASVPSEAISSDEVAALLSDIPFREPIIDDANDHGSKAEKQWRVVTEATRRAILTDPEARRFATGLIDRRLSEKLPEEMFRGITEINGRAARVAKMGGAVVSLLELDPVPDELIHPDIKTAPELVREQGVARMVEIYKEVGFDVRERLGVTRESVSKQPGISGAEKRLIARRYRYARDVKLLALMAELYDNPLDSHTLSTDTISHELPSGTKLVMTSEALEAAPVLLNPRYWESREQIKDRVYRVSVEGKSYIMKERKTSRHRDTMNGGHRSGLTSAQEFSTARTFSELGAVRRNDIEVHGEKPLGYVEFPDGYQFCMFEDEPDLGSGQSEQLAREIGASEEEYLEEFTQIRQRAKEIYNSREYPLQGDEDDLSVRPRWFDFSKEARLKRKSYKNQPAPDELTFEEFSTLKALSLFAEARELLEETVSNHGYVDYDFNQHTFRVRKGKRPTLEIVRFDYEYCFYSPDEAKHHIELKSQRDEEGFSALSMLQQQRFSGERMIASAASYALVERTGLTMTRESGGNGL